MTDEWRLDPLVLRVVAWHNRHPLARRVTPQQVGSLGFVALPFTASVAERTDAPTATPAQAASVAAPDAPPDNATRAAFSKAFIAHLAARRVVRWAARHARAAAVPPAGGPMRQVAVDDSRVALGHRVVMRYAMTAAVQAGGARTRVLVGPDPQSPLLGRRLWSRPRAALAGGGLLATLALVISIHLSPGPADDTATAAAAPVSLAAAPAASALLGLVDAAASQAAPLVQAPPEDALPVHQAPPDVEPRLGRIDLPPVGLPGLPPIDGRVRAAARQARTESVPAHQAAAKPAGTTQAFWAVTTSLLRTRAESQQLMQALDELLREQGHRSLQVEMLPEGDDWRVVGWPFTRRGDAERARALLLARGLKLEVVDF